MSRAKKKKGRNESKASIAHEAKKSSTTILPPNPVLPPKPIRGKIASTFAQVVKQVRRFWSLIAAFFALATLYFEYRPNVKISSSVSLDPAYAFATKFTVENESRLSIFEVAPLCTLHKVNTEPQFIEFAGLSILDRRDKKNTLIPEIRPHESHDVDCPFGAVLDPFRTEKPKYAEISIDVSYTYLYGPRLAANRCFRTEENERQELVWTRKACLHSAKASSIDDQVGARKPTLHLEKVRPTIEGIDTKTGYPTQFNVHFGNKGPSTIFGLRLFSDVKIFTGHATDKTDQIVFNEFLNDLKNAKKEYEKTQVRGRDVGVSKELWTTVGINRPLTLDERQNAANGNLRVYLLGSVYWKDNPDGVFVCMYTSKAIATQTVEKMPWHYCDLRG